MGSHNPPTFVGTRSSQQSMWDLTIHLSSGPSVLVGTRSSQQLWDLTIHPPLGPSVLDGTRSSQQSMWDLTIHPPSRSSVLVGTRSSNVRSHNPPTFRPSVLAITRSSLQSMWDLTNYQFINHFLTILSSQSLLFEYGINSFIHLSFTMILPKHTHLYGQLQNCPPNKTHPLVNHNHFFFGRDIPRENEGINV